MTEHSKVGQPFPCPAEARRRRMADPNANRPGYKHTKVGWIPEEWSCTPLGELFTQRTTMGEPGLPVLSVTMDQGLVPRASLDRKMAPNIAPENSLLVEPGDIAYNMMRMWQGSVAVVQTRGVVSPAYVVCRPCKAVDPWLMLYQFKSQRGLYRLWAYSYGITGDRLRLYFPDFGLVSIPLPPLPEQQKIAEILSTWDDAIEQTRALIAAKQQQKKALMQQLLTGKRRLPGFEGEWTRRRLQNVLTERRETGGNDLELLAITGNRGIIPASEIDRKDSSNVDKNRYKVIRVGDLGYNTMRMWQGVNAISALEGIVSPAYTIATPDSCQHGPFLKHYFKFQPVVYQFYRYSQGLVSDTWNLKFHHFAEILLPFPELAEQRAIAAVLDTADRELKSLQDKLAALKEQKKGLMQKLLTGQVRVKTK
jgi:type I restriction enzyme S subunit